jgi:hypothetical protein
VLIEKKRKIREKEAIGRATVRAYKSRLIHLGSERYHVLDLKRDVFLR